MVDQTNPPQRTQLTPQETIAFQRWRGTLPADLQNMTDYDLAGAWKGQVQQDGRAHMPDTYKLPNHMTFSEGSRYSTPATPGGTWVDGAPGFKGAEEKHPWVYWATPFNLTQHSPSEMSQYFQQYEPASTVVLPINYTLPGGMPRK